LRTLNNDKNEQIYLLKGQLDKSKDKITFFEKTISRLNTEIIMLK